jgi:hypothetical protein
MWVAPDGCSGASEADFAALKRVLKQHVEEQS